MNGPAHDNYTFKSLNVPFKPKAPAEIIRKNKGSVGYFIMAEKTIHSS